jgi:hypothetical protein
MRYKSLLIVFALFLTRFNSYADEGMWIPKLLEQMNEKEMKDMGMNIDADDIYSIKHSSMKDAVVLFGRGCTAEIISGKGLLLTNYHCGYGQIQRHSSIEQDYLTDGFWAMSPVEELPNPGLTVTMMMDMKEVTHEVLNGVTNEMTNADRNDLIKENAKAIIDNYEKQSEYKAFIKPFFQGNKYYMIVVQVFKDIRLVGAPPSDIGKFGGDTDNWVWPRHTGDFSLFRIYVGPDGKPAEYSENNVPYEPKYFFPISLDGVTEDDFTFVFGYPARTNEYVPSYAVELVADVENPVVINLRQHRLDIFNKYQENDPEVRIQYANKNAGVSNRWKKMIGQSKGIHRMNGIEKKQFFEEEFNDWVQSDTKLRKKYGGLLPTFEKAYREFTPLMVGYEYYTEAGMAIELVRFAGNFEKLVKLSKDKTVKPEEINEATESLKKQAKSFFKDYYKPIDAEVMAELLRIYGENIITKYKPEFFNLIQSKYANDYTAYTTDVFKKSFLDDENAVNQFLENYKNKNYKKIEKDPAFRMYIDLQNVYDKLQPGLTQVSNELDSLQRIYMAGQMEMQPDHRFYPDANFTLRVTYGLVKGYQPADAEKYRYFTTLKGIMEKENPDIYDYVVEDKLKELYNKKDYGQYADADGSLHVAFIATNHTTGGNSGSPVLNADGYLVGLNFDRCWEGTMSDLMFDPEVCRNISLDIRYFLFIVDKFAGAGYLLDEMNLVKNN